MQATRIILVRHGETEANRQRRFAASNEIPLTETGRLQATELASRLAREFQPDRLLSSPYRRARETSEIIGAALHLETEPLAGIHERDFGCLKGLPYERMGELMLADTTYDPARPWLWTPPGGESLDNVRRRVIAALERLTISADREILLVCHGAVIQSIAAHITGEWQESYVPPNCGYAVLDHGHAGWSRPILSGDWECLSNPAS